MACWNLHWYNIGISPQIFIIIMRTWLFFIGVICSQSAMSQPIATYHLSDLTSNTFGGDSLDRGLFVLPLNEKRTIIGGLSYSKSREGDVVLWTLDDQLNVQSEKNIGIPGFDFAFAASQGSDDNFLLTGFSNNRAQGLDAYVIKINAAGDTVWTSTLSQKGDDRATRLLEVADGYVVSGQSNSSSVNGNPDMLLYKLDKKGKIIWQKTLGTSMIDRAFNIVAVPGGDFVVTGLIGEAVPGNSDIFIKRFTTNGELIWEKTFGGVRTDVAHAMVRQEKSILTIGYTSEHSFPFHDPLVLELDFDGNVMRKYTIAVGADIRLMDGYLEGNHLIATGHFREVADGQTDVAIVKLDLLTGIFSVARIEAGSGNEEAYSLLQLSAGKSLIVGHSYSSGNFKGDVLVFKFPHRLFGPPGKR